MSPLRAAWIDYRDAARTFSRPARLYLAAELLAWTGHGVFQVLFNLYLARSGFQEAFIGRTVSINAVGLALTALPAGILADRWGRRRALVLGASLDGAGQLVRCLSLTPGVIYGASFVAGCGQSFLAIAAAPFLAEHSTARERTHLFSTYFAAALVAGVFGSILGGWIPAGLQALPMAWRPDLVHAYRAALVLGALFVASACIPLLRLGGLREAKITGGSAAPDSQSFRLLFPIALNSFLIGCGAGLVIPFMNLYFATRFQSTSADIGLYFSIAQIFTAAASLLGPAIARRFGKLRTAVASELLSLPFLVSLGAEKRLSIAVAAFWLRATLMQASTPLVGAFVMETLPPELRARSSSLNNLVWNTGWAVSATFAGLIIQRFGYAVPFYMTAVLYAAAAGSFYWSFRKTPEVSFTPSPVDEARGDRGEGPFRE